MENDMITLLKTRRSVRKYRPEPVEKEKLDAVLEAGTYAPSGMNKQTATIVAVENPEDRRAVQELNCKARGGTGDPYYGAPAILLVLGDPRNSNTWVEDGSCVLSAMMQAATHWAFLPAGYTGNGRCSACRRARHCCANGACRRSWKAWVLLP